MDAMKYPSDISREEIEKVRPELEGFKKQTNPRIYDLYDIFCAVLYIVKTYLSVACVTSRLSSA
jgi:hypothetical protein